MNASLQIHSLKKWRLDTQAAELMGPRGTARRIIEGGKL